MTKRGHSETKEVNLIPSLKIKTVVEEIKQFFLNIWIDAIWWQVVWTMAVYLQEGHKNVIHQRYTTNTTLNYKFHLFKGSECVPFVVVYLFLQWTPISFMLLCTLRSYLFNARETPKTWIVQHWPPPTPGHLWHNIFWTYTIWEYILMHIFHWKKVIDELTMQEFYEVYYVTQKWPFGELWLKT